MIIVKIIGGLGNQMFQYACGRSLSLRYQTPLKLDLEAYKTYKLHTYQLSIFNIKAVKASAAEINSLIPANNRFIRKIQKIFHRPKYYHSEILYRFNKLKIQDQTAYLDGYWQSELYFKNYANIITADFTFRLSPDPKNQAWLEKINKCNSVGLHVRRGDFVTDPQTFKTNGVCPIEYYQQAVKLIAKKIKQPKFFIFSNDSNWTKTNLRLDFPAYYIDWNKNKSNFEDLRLMSRCRHQIIANSTFSWWAAWLNLNPQKVIIAPKRWFNITKINTNYLIPQRWIRL